MRLKPSVPYSSETAKIKTVCGSIFITTIFDQQEDRRPIGVLLQLGKAGGCAKAHLSVLSEHINLALERGHSEAILALSNLSGVTCSAGDSCVDAAVRNIFNRLITLQEADYE